MTAIGHHRRLRRVLGYLRPFKMPGVPTVPGFVAHAALRRPGLVPVWFRWRAASLGLGLVVARSCAQAAHPLAPSLHETSAARARADDETWAGGGRGGMGALLQTIGYEQGLALSRGLGYGVDPAECARAVALANRLFGIRARAVVEGPGLARVVTPGCLWSRTAFWGRRPCGAFSRYEHGLVAGMNPHVSHHHVSKVTRGDEYCVGVYSWRPGAAL